MHHEWGKATKYTRGALSQESLVVGRPPHLALVYAHSCGAFGGFTCGSVHIELAS